jgi:hypothetical protein
VVIEKQLAPGWRTVVRWVTGPFMPLARAWGRRARGELERREAGLRRQVRDAYEERLLTLNDDLAAAAAARDQATALLVSLVQQLFSEYKRYLYDAGVTERDLVGLNQVLAPKGVQIRSACRHRARQGTCTLQHGAGQRTVFWREPVTPGATAAEASAGVA